MPISALPQAPFRQDRKIFPTPLIGDVLFSEVRDCNRILIPEYGTPHPDTSKWPHHKLVYVKPVDIERDGLFEFFYAADRENQDLYNFEVGRLRVGTLSVPMVKRTYLSPRESFDLTEPLLGSAMPNIPLGKFEDGYILHEINQVRAESEFDSLFVREEHVYILPLSTISRSAEDQDYVILESHVGEADAPDTYTGVVESSVMAIGNGKAVKTTKVAITDFNDDDDTYDIGFSDLRGVIFDPRYGIRVEIERSRVDPDSDIGENPSEDNGIVRAVSRDPDSIRQSRQETRLYTLPEDQVWYGSRRASNLPRVLDRIEIVDSKQNPTLVPIFKPQYDGILPARWTRKFTFGPPEKDFSGRVYKTEEFVYITEYDRESESRSVSNSLSVSDNSGTSTSTNTGSSTSNNSGTSISTNTGSSTSSSSGTSNSTNTGSSTSDNTGTSNSTSTGSSTSTNTGTSSSSSSGSSTSSNSGTSSSTNTGSSTSSGAGTSTSSNAGTSNSTSSGTSASNNYGVQSSYSGSGSGGSSESTDTVYKGTGDRGAPAGNGAQNIVGTKTVVGISSSGSSSSSSGNNYSGNNGSSTSSSSGSSTSDNVSSSTSDSSGTSTSSNTGTSDANSSGSSTSSNTGTSSSNSSGSSTSGSSGTSTSNSSGSSTSSNTSASSSNSSGSSTSGNSGTSTSDSSGSSTSENTGSSTSRSLSDSSSESNSVSFGKSVLSLQIPACLRRNISVTVGEINININIPATEPTSLEDGQWVIEDVSSNHWQDGIWVTEIVEVYLGNL